MKMEKYDEIMSLKDVKKVQEPRTRFADNAVCELCGCTRADTKLRKFNGYILCSKHYQQLKKYGKITDPTSVVHKYEVKKCCICGEKKHATLDGRDYCQKHFLQMQRHGKIIDRTIYDKNEYVLYDDYAEIIMYDKNGNENGRTKVDLDKIEELKKYKIYMKGFGRKQYANLNLKDGKKIRLNRYLLGITDLDTWDGKIVVDHINGDSLDNRSCNLRKCTHKQNMQNIRKKTFVGVKRNNTDTKWVATIMHNYKPIWLGCYKMKEEAMLARLKGEKEICGEFGPNKDLYYIIDLPSPIEELKKITSSEGV